MKITGDRTGFWSQVSAVTYGDDNVVNPSLEVIDRFNQVTVSTAMWEYLRLVYTSGKKDGELAPYTTVDRVTFLKRAIVHTPDGWLSPLELDSFLYSIYWCKNKRLRLQITYDELENALEELSMHDQVVWDKYAGKICELIRRLDKEPKCFPVREQYLRVVLSRADAWY